MVFLPPDFTEMDMYDYMVKVYSLDDFRCRVLKEGSYVMYQMSFGGVWFEDVGCNEILKRIRGFIPAVEDLKSMMYTFVQDDMIEKYNLNPKEVSYVMDKLVAKKVTQILPHMLKKKLGQSDYPKHLLTIIKEQLCDNAWAELMDTDPMLLGFNDCIYSLKEGRKLTGEEVNNIAPVTMSTKLNFNEMMDYVVDPNNAHIKIAYDKFLSEVFTDKDLRDYTMSSLAKALDGTNMLQLFYIFTGKGANGKSVTFDLFKRCLGDYYLTCNPDILLANDAINSNGASPAITKLKGKRVLRFDEPESKNKMKAGVMKKLCSGTDELTGRNLFENKVHEFICQGTPFIVCNHTPELKDVEMDGGTHRRFNVVPFLSKFVAKPSKPNEFHRDDKLMTRFVEDKWCYFMLHDLLTRYKLPLPEAPKCVIEKSLEYLESQDSVLTYINTFVVQTNVDKDFFLYKDIKKHYAEWAKAEGYAELKQYKFKKLVIEALDNFYVSKTINNVKRENVWVGYKLVIQPNEDLIEDDEE
jgi:P4 family phage/plasmid primase-like protien